MKPSPLLLAAVLFAAGAANASGSPDHLQPFASEKAFQNHLAKIKAREAEARRKAESKFALKAYDMPMPTAAPASPAPAPAAAASEAKSLDTVQVTGSRVAAADAPESDAITNVQTQGVDEGGIVKKLGEVIVELKSRGFTIVLVEQNFRFAAPLADRHYVLEHGEIIATISAEELPGKMDWLHQTLGV